jgi:hypothetical protein
LIYFIWFFIVVYLREGLQERVVDGRKKRVVGLGWRGSRFGGLPEGVGDGLKKCLVTVKFKINNGYENVYIYDVSSLDAP